jgi:hypothetical protein
MSLPADVRHDMRLAAAVRAAAHILNHAIQEAVDRGAHGDGRCQAAGASRTAHQGATGHGRGRQGLIWTPARTARRVWGQPAIHSLAWYDAAPAPAAWAAGLCHAPVRGAGCHGHLRNGTP